jgi:teichuronic acid biosynthesis glycosyltransferase TuaH
VLLYVGTLDYLLRIDWLTELAQSLPDATILLVGLELDARAFDPLRGLKNVIIHPAIEDRHQFAALIRQADVGLIPHRRTPLTETIEPQKVWEYLAGGLPVVSTDLPPIRGIDPRVDLVSDEGDFTAAVRRALARGRIGDAERLAFVEDNSWRARHHSLIGLALA